MECTDSGAIPILQFLSYESNVGKAGGADLIKNHLDSTVVNAYIGADVDLAWSAGTDTFLKLGSEFFGRQSLSTKKYLTVTHNGDLESVFSERAP